MGLGFLGLFILKSSLCIRNKIQICRFGLIVDYKSRKIESG